MNATLARRKFLAGTCVTTLALARLPASQAESAGWPNRLVRLVVPGAPGGLFDIWSRQLIDRLSPAFGQPVVPDYRVGAGGLLAMQHLARSAPDGYTFGICSFTQLTVNPWMFEKPAYDPVRDFAPVSALWASQVVLCPIQTVGTCWAASRPGAATHPRASGNHRTDHGTGPAPRRRRLPHPYRGGLLPSWRGRSGLGVLRPLGRWRSPASAAAPGPICRPAEAGRRHRHAG